MSRRNRKKIILLSLLMCLAIIFTGCNGNDSLKFNEDNAYNHIKELSSDKYEGRLPGTGGHKKASEYIANEFMKIGLTPLNNRNKYFQEFQDYSPLLEGEPTFEAIDKNGEVVSEYIIRDDYTELPINNTIGGLIEGNATIVKSIEEIENDNKIILSSKTFNNNTDIEKLKKLGVNLVISPSNDNSEKRFLKTVITDGNTDDGEESKLISILVKPHVFSELVKHTKEGYSIKFNLDLKVKKVNMRNVIGYIPAKDKETKEALIISAHFDHVGYDKDDKIFNGALDNASGVGVLLEVARAIKDSDISPKKNIVFVAFDGEESGLKGSTYYTRSRPFDLIGSKIINLDMIGSKEKLDLYIDYFPNSQASHNLAEEIKNKLGADVKMNASSASDHAVFGDKDIPAITLNHPSMKSIHTYSDDIKNIDKETLKDPGELVLKILDYYGIKATDLINSSISDTQNNNMYVLLAIVIFIIIIFLILLKYRKKKGKPILTITLLIVIMISILLFNSFYEYEEYGTSRMMLNTDKYKGEPWKESEITTEVQNIYDSNFNENINIVVNNKKNTEKLTINNKGELSNREEFDIGSNLEKNIKISDHGIYFINDNSLSKINDKNEIETIKEDIIGFDIVRKGNNPYIIATNGEKIYLINKDAIIEKDISGIVNVKARKDENENIHIILEKEQNSNTQALYLYTNSNNELGEAQSIAKIDKNTDIQFGLDIGKGYLFINDKKNIKYGTFNLGARSSSIRSFKELELTGDGGIKVDEDIDLTINNSVKDEQLALLIKGKDKYDSSYIFFEKLYNGKITEKEIIYKKDKVSIKDLQILNSGNYSYAFWMEGKGDDHILKASSSNPEFANEQKKVDLLIKIGSIIQNILWMPIFLASRIYFILPGLIIIGIYKLFKKGDNKNFKIVAFISLIINILFQIIFMKDNYVFGYRIEYIIVPIIIAICASIITFFYLKETKNKKILRVFIIFTLINMILLSTLYAPYSLESGRERIQNQEEKLFE